MRKFFSGLVLSALGVLGLWTMSSSVFGTGQSQIVIVCDTWAQVLVYVSDLDFGAVVNSGGQQQATGLRVDSGGWFTGIKLSDEKATCGETGANNPLWYISLSIWNLLDNDGTGITYALQPHTFASSVFDYTSNSGFIRLGIWFDTGDITLLSGSDIIGDTLVPWDLYEYDNDVVTSSSLWLVKRLYVTDDTRVGSWIARPRFVATLPWSMPAKIYIGSVNIYIQ